MALSDAHLVRHCVEIHERYINNGDGGGGGHAGMSLNIYCGILGEAPERISALMAKAKYSDAPGLREKQVKQYETMHGKDWARMYPHLAAPGEGYYFRPST